MSGISAMILVTVGDHDSATFTCPAGSSSPISVSAAIYGYNCNAPDVAAEIASSCSGMGATWCTISPQTGTYQSFTGTSWYINFNIDPCVGEDKALSNTYSCSSSA